MLQFFKKEAAYIRANYSALSVVWILFVSLAWLFLWFVPWQTWIETKLWLKVGIALAIFIIPGACFYVLINRGAVANLRYITSGFILSHLLIALLGLTGRIFQFPFSYVKNTFMALGLVLIVLHLLRGYLKTALNHEKDFSLSLEMTTLPHEMTTYSVFRHFLKNSQSKNDFIAPRLFIARYATYWPLAIVAGLAMLMTIQRVVTSDDLAYLAHSTNWQNMPNLNFSDVYFGSEKIESARFLIFNTPFSQAFLADIGNIPGLILLSGYYEPFLALISIICFYDLARTLGLAHAPAMASVAVQVTFMALLSDYLHPGAPFFHQLSTDKATAAFILAPVFIANAVELLRDGLKAVVKDFSLPLEMTTQTLEMTTYRGFRHFLRGLKQSTAINFLLSGLSLSFMHPILSAFAVFIVGAISFFGIRRENFKKHSIVILLAMMTLLPQR